MPYGSQMRVSWGTMPVASAHTSTDRPVASASRSMRMVPGVVRRPGEVGLDAGRGRVVAAVAVSSRKCSQAINPARRARTNMSWTRAAVA